MISHVQSTIEAMSNKYYKMNGGRVDLI
jgi:hypothetical protein